MAAEKTRWVQVGALWDYGKGEMSGNISLGLLGEVKVLIRPNTSVNPRAPAYNIIAKVEELPLNRLSGDAPAPFRRAPQDPAPSAPPPVCGDTHPQRADCRCTLLYGHEDEHKGATGTGEQKTWANTNDIPF